MKDDPVLFEHLGDVYKTLGDPAKAIESYEKSLRQHEKEEGLKDRVEQKLKELRQSGSAEPLSRFLKSDDTDARSTPQRSTGPSPFCAGGMTGITISRP
ncbi:MAG: tetratricopeptide repeat protein [Desulfobacterales bacterium]|nr:tetratricopeptide repeat protein [Desulfobacterales bacterium]